MATQVQFRRGSTAQIAAATPAAGEIVVDTDKDTVVVGDGSTAGGFEVARADGSNWAITNGLTVDGNVSVASALPRIILEENDATDLNTAIRNNGGVFKIQTVNDAANSFTNRMDINHSSGDIIMYGDVGIGTSSPNALLHVGGTAETQGSQANPAIQIGSTSGYRLGMYTDAEGGYIENKNGDNGLIFRVKTAGEAMRIDGGTGNVGIGSTSPSSTFRASINGDGSSVIGGIEFRNAAAGGSTFTIGHASATSPSGTLNVVGAGNMIFKTNDAERMRIGSSGSLMVGKNTTAIATAGTFIGGGSSVGYVEITRDNNRPLRINRTSSDGQLVRFDKDGTNVGSIGTVSDGLYIASPVSSDSGLRFSGATVHPCTTSGAPRDNAIDLGYASGRYKDLYRSGSTISTSDRNMKQDIRDLTDAERNVAVAAKGLLKAFRFIDTVAAEGDSANIHFGIIAQDLAAVFTAEGLDANDYQVYRADTFTDDEGNEQTRLGICYENLLAFIISAI